MADDLTQKELAQRLGLTSRQIHNLREDGLPHASEAGKITYPWPKALHWYIDWKAGKLADRTKGDGDEESDRKKIRIERERLELEQLRMDVQERRGTLIEFSVHEQELEDLTERMAGAVKGTVARFVREIERAATPEEAIAVAEQLEEALLRAGLDLADEMDARAEEDDAGGAADGDAGEAAVA